MRFAMWVVENYTGVCIRVQNNTSNTACTYKIVSYEAGFYYNKT